MKKVNDESKEKLKLKKFLIAEVNNPEMIMGGNDDDPIETFPTQKPQK